MLLSNVLDKFVKDQWVSCSDTYESIVWKEGVDIPSKEEVENKIKEHNAKELKAKMAFETQQQKQKELDTLTVSLNSVPYDAHMEGLGNMGIVVGGMTYKALKAMAKLSPNMQAIYDETFQQTVQWKGADNKLHTVQVESLAQTLEEAMNEKAQILYKY